MRSTKTRVCLHDAYANFESTLLSVSVGSQLGQCYLLLLNNGIAIEIFIIIKQNKASNLNFQELYIITVKIKCARSVCIGLGLTAKAMLMKMKTLSAVQRPRAHAMVGGGALFSH